MKVGWNEGFVIGVSVGVPVGLVDGSAVGFAVSLALGLSVGLADGFTTVGATESMGVGIALGLELGVAAGMAVDTNLDRLVVIDDGDVGVLSVVEAKKERKRASSSIYLGFPNDKAGNANAVVTVNKQNATNIRILLLDVKYIIGSLLLIS